MMSNVFGIAWALLAPHTSINFASEQKIILHIDQYIYIVWWLLDICPKDFQTRHVFEFLEFLTRYAPEPCIAIADIWYHNLIDQYRPYSIFKYFLI